jgi:hypothetical protein
MTTSSKIYLPYLKCQLLVIKLRNIYLCTPNKCMKEKKAISTEEKNRFTVSAKISA